MECLWETRRGERGWARTEGNGDNGGASIFTEKEGETVKYFWQIINQK